MIALGGTAYAAGSIGTKQIADDGVTSADIKNRTIKGRDVKPG